LNVRFHGRKPEPVFGVAPQAKGNAAVTSVSRLKTKSPAQQRGAVRARAQTGATSVALIEGYKLE
jgi:hypothetical protein